MNKKIALSLMSIVTALAMAGGATYAFFTDTATSANNTFRAGSLNINILNNAAEQDFPFNVSDLAPGDTVTRYITVANDGTEDMKFRAYISEGTGELGQALRIKSVTLHPTDYDGNDDLTTAGYTLAGPPNHVVFDGTPIPFSALTNPNNPPFIWDQGVGGTLDAFKPDWAATYKIVVEMDPQAGDEFQGKSWTGSLKFEATQESNPTF